MVDVHGVVPSDGVSPPGGVGVWAGLYGTRGGLKEEVVKSDFSVSVGVKARTEVRIESSTTLMVR